MSPKFYRYWISVYRKWHMMLQIEKIKFNAARKMMSRPDANWENISNVDFGDLSFFIDQCRRKKDKESFDIAEKVLTAIRRQTLGEDK